MQWIPGLATALAVNVFLFSPGCDSSNPDNTGGEAGTGGDGQLGGNTVNGGSNGQGGSASSGGSPSGGGTAGGGAGGPGGAASNGGSVGTGGAVGSGGATATGLAPIIPSVSGACPDFISGTQMIMGLSTEIVAGERTSMKGPLLITWHGTGGNGSRAISQVPPSVRDAIVGLGGLIIAPSDNGQTRVGASPNGVWYETSDLEYADQIVACAVANHNIDPRRIYVMGCSAGGLMTGAMALKRSTYVAAATPNSGGISNTMQGRTLQDPTRVPVVMAMHGGAPDTVIVNFQETSERLLTLLKPYGTALVACNHASGHCGAPPALLEAAWQFMYQHPFGTSAPAPGALPASFPSYCVAWK